MLTQQDFYAMIIRYCSPTLAGIKTAGLFAAAADDEMMLYRYIAEFNRKVLKKGLCLIPVSHKKNHFNLFLYRPDLLKKDLECELCRSILKSYQCYEGDMHQCLYALRKRMQNNKDFPHEIGLFLGYPPEDVYGFIKHREVGCKHIGVWRVYDNVERAQCTFMKYQACTKILSQRFLNGTPIEQLAVSI